MNRPIKFRAWMKADPVTKDGRWLKDYEFKMSPNGEISTYGIYTHPDNIIVQQFTGLHDKNGKEIYEGDILSFNSRPPSGSVSFEGGSYWVGDAVLGRASVQSEVIGNIYENKDLLT